MVDLKEKLFGKELLTLFKIYFGDLIWKDNDLKPTE